MIEKARKLRTEFFKAVSNFKLNIQNMMPEAPTEETMLAIASLGLIQLNEKPVAAVATTQSPHRDLSHK